MTRQEALIAVLKKSFNDCWSAETSSDPAGWTPANPSYGHCAVASLVAQVVLGGELLRYDLKDTLYEHLGSHYKNRLPDGTIIDFTEEQFNQGLPDWSKLEVKVRARNELLDPKINPRNQGTLDRYKLFSKRAREWLDSFGEGEK